MAELPGGWLGRRFDGVSGTIDAARAMAVTSRTAAEAAIDAGGFKGEMRYTLVAVVMAEGVRLQAQLEGTDAKDVAVGMPVEVRFEKAKEDLVLPHFVRARA